MSNAQVDVAIVGGGLVGLSLAVAIAPSRLNTVLIDAGAAPVFDGARSSTPDGATLTSGISPRVSTLNLASKEFLSRIKGWPDASRICAFTDMFVWDARGTANIEFNAADIGEPHLGYVVENLNILATLHSRASELDDIEMLWETKIDSIESVSDGYLIKLEGGREITADLLVGADGGNSIVRRECGLHSLDWNYGQDAIVTTIMTEMPHEATARQCFTEHGPLAFLPLAAEGEKLCSIVWSSDIKEELLALDDEAFCKRVTVASESVLGRVIATDKRFTFPLRQQHALRYTRPHLALVGDAAHTIHPLAGQGANLGLADANSLAALLNECRFTGQTPGDPALLRRYQMMRQPANLLMTLVMEGFKRLYEPDHPALNWLRNAGTRVVDNVPRLKSLVMRLAGGR